MRGLVLASLLVIGSAFEIGCVIPIYSSNSDERTRQMVFVSEGFRHITKIWERVWFLDMPDNATAYRVHGGII